MQFNRGRGRVSADELRRRVVLLHDEILKLEQVLEGSSDGDIGAADAAVRRLRYSIVQEELVRKRSELEAVKVDAVAAGIDVDKAIAEDQLNRFAPSGALSGVFVLSQAPKPKERRRPPLIFAIAAAVVLLVGIGGLLAARSSGGQATASTGRTTLAPLAAMQEAAPVIPSQPVAQRGETFFTRDIEVTFQRGRMYLSGDPAPDAEFNVDDGLRIVVTRPDGSTAAWSRDFNTGCIRNESVAAQDVTSLFQPGLNQVAITLYDICGANKGATAIYLVNRD